MSEERTRPLEKPLPRAELRVWPHGEAGVRLWLVAWDTDRPRIERLRDHLPRLFADGPLVWDGVALRGGEWGWLRLSDPDAGEVEDEDEWSPPSVRAAEPGAPVPGGFVPVRCQACHAVVMVPVNECAPVICPDCHALDEAHAAEADDEPPFQPPPGPPHPPVHLLGAESRWWAPGHEPAQGSPWWRG
jgi:hypothetical protein